MRSGLPLLMRVAGRPVILLGEGEAAEAKRRLLERAGARIVGEDDGGAARLAIIAIADDGDARAAIDRLRARGVLINAVDRPDQCDFTLPAIVDRDPVLVAVSTGGVSAGLAAALRQRLELLLPARLGDLAQWLGAARDRFASTAERRRAIADALSAGGALDPLAPVGRAQFDRWLAEPHAPVAAFHAIRLRSDDPDDLTLREARWLAAADRVTHRPGVAAAILDRARADAERIACAAPPADPGPGVTIDVERG
ncbi:MULTISPECIES: precorrin-2 dehydrogenase/sirohydrochlorin ferrochelatase family protein [unclassified Sphingomonas]|jgi:uroporphyrin-III C-methyltransferase/precorrin-2 dehydrogenase/sirohydrochlorin ferrochelatase|uniref:precorrin-2 dehydrogenase/sirohydrochlorin ferrochelatase family protein n=1 Tax=unclassified Sphingomonas TaxID=196159 RepID=UPI0008334C10|nr:MULTISPECIES: NAD(P)-dependent oxidoreductase [unclassified Sphingomonas]